MNKDIENYMGAWKFNAKTYSSCSLKKLQQNLLARAVLTRITRWLGIIFTNLETKKSRKRVELFENLEILSENPSLPVLHHKPFSNLQEF